MTFAELRDIRMHDGQAFISHFKDLLRERRYKVPFIKKNGNWGIEGSRRFESKYEIKCFDEYFIFLIDVDSEITSSDGIKKEYEFIIKQ